MTTPINYAESELQKLDSEALVMLEMDIELQIEALLHEYKSTDYSPEKDRLFERLITCEFHRMTIKKVLLSRH